MKHSVDTIAPGPRTRAVLWGLFSVFAWLVVGPVRAQTTCAPGTAEAYLDAGNVRAKILNNGGLFWNGGQSLGYEVPKGQGAHSLFSANLWVGGMVDDDLRMAATLYGPFQYWTGPVDDCVGYDRIWTVEYADLADGADAEDRLMAWPVQAGAPFIDVNGDGEYHPDDGDRPEVLGDQQHWWIMNDAPQDFRDTVFPRLGLEIRATAFAFDVQGAVGNTTFYRYRMKNTRSGPLRDAFVGLFIDVGVGSLADDFVGSDSTLGMGYAYNADNVDDGAYGNAPPAIGFTVLKRPGSAPSASVACGYPDAKPTGFTHVMHFIGGAGVTGEPGTQEDYYNYIQSRWKDGQPVTLGGQGRAFSDEPVRYFFPGDPVAGAYWSEMNRDDQGTASSPFDRSLIVGLGPFCMEAGEEVEWVMAIVWSRGDSHLDSVSELRKDVAHIHSIRDALLKPRVLPGGGDGPDEQPDLPFAASVYPNPVGGGGGGGGGGRSATVRISTPEPLDVSVRVFNALGQRIHTAAERSPVQAGDHSWTLPTTAWTPGIYLIRITAGHAVTTRRLVVTGSQ